MTKHYNTTDKRFETWVISSSEICWTSSGRIFSESVDEVSRDGPNVLVDDAVEVEVEGVVTGPEEIEEDVVIDIHIRETWRETST